MAGALVVGGLARFGRALANPKYPSEELTAVVSGIRWLHRAGKSRERFLRETTGPDCAFFDYDNDGWMDNNVALIDTPDARSFRFISKQ